MPGKNGQISRRPPFGAAQCAGDRPHLAAVLQEGRKYAHIRARSGDIWGIPAKI